MSYKSAHTAAVRIDGRQERRGTQPVRRPAEAAPAQRLDAAPEEAADLYYRKAARKLTYRHFDSAGAAIHFVRDNLSEPEMRGAALQVGEHRFEGAELAAMVRQAAPAQQAAR